MGTVIASLIVLLLVGAAIGLMIRGVFRGVAALVGLALVLAGLYACTAGLGSRTQDDKKQKEATSVTAAASTKGWQVTIGGNADGPFVVKLDGIEIARPQNRGTVTLSEPAVAHDNYRPSPVRTFQVTSTRDDVRASTEVCSPVVILAARGTNENPRTFITRKQKKQFGHGIGSRGWRTWEYVQQDLGLPKGTDNTVVSAHPVRYSALPIDGIAGYSGSRNGGTEALLADWREVTKKCSATQIVMVGYSQGADVVASAWQKGKVAGGRLSIARAIDRNQVRSVVLYADPHFNRRWADQGVTRPRTSSFIRDGVFGARRLFTGDEVGAVQAWCLLQDPICQRDNLAYPWHGSQYDRYEEWAAADIARAVTPGLRAAGYTVQDAADPSLPPDPGRYRP